MTTGDRRQADDGHPSITPAIEPSAEVAAVLAEAIGADTAKTAGVLARYRHDPAWKLLAAFVGRLCVGVAGYTADDSEVTLRHIAVVATDRHSGYGRALISAVLAGNPQYRRVVAETDAEAVGFYRALGFVVTRLGERYPGVERFRVCLNVDAQGTRQPSRSKTGGVV